MKTHMDAIQFGKWISEKRKKGGWASQRAFVETVRQDAMLADLRISEDFIARLEAGRLAFPFRPAVRKQVMALAWLLCKTPRDLQHYLHAAGLADLSPIEAEMVGRLQGDLSPRKHAVTLILPARPPLFLGRDEQLKELLGQLRALDTGLCAVTGMAGIGKSALVAEAVHMLVEHEHMRSFADGVVTLSCTGRQGVSGAIDLLAELFLIFADGQTPPLRAFEDAEPHLAGMIDAVRLLLAGKSVLFVLDDVDPQFPIRVVMDALLGTSQHSAKYTLPARARRMVLTTGRFIPAPALVRYHCALGGLELPDALSLMADLLNIDSATTCEEQGYLERICRAVGAHPGALEAAANALVVEGVPLPLLAANCELNPLTTLLTEHNCLYAALKRQLALFSSQTRELFALLSILDGCSFQLECVATFSAPDAPLMVETSDVSLYALAATHSRTPLVQAQRNRSRRQESSGRLPVEEHMESLHMLTTTALELGRLVSNSLLEKVFPTTDQALSTFNSPRYRLHPLLQAYARELAQQLPPARVAAAKGRLLHYFVAHLQGSASGDDALVLYR